MLLITTFLSMLALIFIYSILKKNYAAVFIILMVSFSTIILQRDVFTFEQPKKEGVVFDYLLVNGFLLYFPTIVIIVFTIALFVELIMKNIVKYKASHKIDYMISKEEREEILTYKTFDEKSMHFEKGLKYYDDDYLYSIQEQDGWDSFELTDQEFIGDIVIDYVTVVKREKNRIHHLSCSILKHNGKLLLNYEIYN